MPLSILSSIAFFCWPRFRAERRIKNRKNRNKTNKLREPSAFRTEENSQGARRGSQGAKEVPSQV